MERPLAFGLAANGLHQTPEVDALAVTTLQTYEQAQAFLFDRINFEKSQPAPTDLKLERMRRLLDVLGNPQDRIPAVHIAGTKGKGSTAAMIASILQSSGYRTALYTSPHLAKFEERMQVNARTPSTEEVVTTANRVHEALSRLVASSVEPTFFEVVTAMAWLYFEDAGADIAVMEVGLGGRLDATNLCRPELSLITTISRDHTAILGNTLAAIAAEKAGIIKPGVPVISGVSPGEARDMIADRANSLGAQHFELDRKITFQAHETARTTDGTPATRVSRTFDLQTPWGNWNDLPVALAGPHQVRNAAMAAAAASLLRQRGWNIPAQGLTEGLRNVRWPARIEVVQTSPTILLDAAHNWASVKALIETLSTDFPPGPRTLIFGGTRDKDNSGLLRQLVPQFNRIILTKYVGNPRAAPVHLLRSTVSDFGERLVHSTASPVEALALAKRLCGPEELICVAGSLFLSAEIRELLVPPLNDASTSRA